MLSASLEIDKLETGEEPDDGCVSEDKDDNECLDTRLAKLGSTPTETTKDDMNSLLQDITSNLDISEQTGSPVNEGIAKIVLSLLKDKIPEEKTQTRINKHPRPENLEELRTPRMKPLLWKQLPANVCTQDSKSQKMLNALVASMVATIEATDRVLQTKR